MLMALLSPKIWKGSLVTGGPKAGPTTILGTASESLQHKEAGRVWRETATKPKTPVGLKFQWGLPKVLALCYLYRLCPHFFPHKKHCTK